MLAPLPARVVQWPWTLCCVEEEEEEEEEEELWATLAVGVAEA